MCARTDGTPKPNLSGEWTLDLLRSDFGRSAPPMSATLTIQHREPDFTVRPLESAAGGPPVLRIMALRTDGIPNAIRLSLAEGNAADTFATASWDGRDIIVQYTVKHLGHNDDFQDTWSLGPEGTVLLLEREVELPDRAGRRQLHRMREVFQRAARSAG
jgi:hypothetical protein